VQDDHVAEIAGSQQVWADDGWAERFGLPAGSGHRVRTHPEQVSAIVSPANDLDRVVDRSFDPPVTVGVRLLSVVGDTLQHVGQAAYVRGLLQEQR
jgi:hypothetical protein